MLVRREATTPSRLPAFAALMVAAALLAAGLPAPASAAPTPAEYALQVNAICAQSELEAERVIGKLDEEPIAVDGPRDQRRLLNRYFRTLSRTLYRLHRIGARRINRLALVAPAGGDEARVADWIATQRAVQWLTKRNLPRYVSYFRLVILVLPDVIVSAFVEQKPLDKQARRRIKKLRRIFNNMDRVERWILDETSRASILAADLGAARCGGDTSPGQDLRRRAARSAARALARLGP